MHDSSTASCGSDESDGEPPPVLQSLKGGKSQETQELFIDRQPAEIARKITELHPGWQVAAFHRLPRHQAIAVYKHLSQDVQHRLMEDFKQSDDFAVCEELLPDERVQLFKLLYIPDTHKDEALQGEREDSAQDDSANHPLAIFKRRFVWLFVLLLASTGTTAVIKSQEDVLQQVVVLASFIPLLIAGGGNASTQAATVVVRTLHQQNTKLIDLFRQVLYRETTASILLGGSLGILVTGEALVLQNNLPVALVVGLSLFVISVLGTLCGSILPFFFEFIGCDPALISAPLSATFIDVVGILIYLYIARLILHL